MTRNRRRELDLAGLIIPQPSQDPPSRKRHRSIETVIGDNTEPEDLGKMGQEFDALAGAGAVGIQTETAVAGSSGNVLGSSSTTFDGYAHAPGSGTGDDSHQTKKQKTSLQLFSLPTRRSPQHNPADSTSNGGPSARQASANSNRVTTEDGEGLDSELDEPPE
jgi:hypothetical protein